jgi:hypothetical protein
MERSAHRLFPPRSPEIVQAAIELLAKVPKTWNAVCQLSNLEEKALGLLVSVGLIERRLSVRFRGVGDTRAVEARFRFTGQAGLIEALEPALAESWGLWGKEGNKVYVEPGDGAGEWRLTDLGEQAAGEAARGDIDFLRTFLRTPAVPGVEMLPPPAPGRVLCRYMPGWHRPIVPGEGHVERVEVVNAEAKPPSVKVENLSEVSSPLADIARVLQEGMRRLEEATRSAATGAATSVKAPAESGTRQPAMMRVWDKDYCPVCAHHDVEWISCAQFEVRTREAGSAVKRETAGTRIKNGAYCADATGRLPWCPVCKGRTPMGTGEREPQLEARQLPSHDQTLLYEEQCCACAAKVMKLKKPPSLRRPPETQEGKYTVIVRDAAREALLAVMEEHRHRGRELTRDEVEVAALPKIKAFLEDHWEMERTAMGDGDDIQHIISASENPRSKGQRGAPHEGEGSDPDD